MKKIAGMTLQALRLPLMAVRTVNAAVMRFPFAWYLAALLLGKEYDSKPMALIMTITAVIALVWGALYVLTKPSIAGQAYLTRWYSVGLRSMIRNRLILMALIGVTVIFAFIKLGILHGALFYYFYAIFCIVELGVNILIIHFVGNGGSNSILDALYGSKKVKKDISNKTVNEICKESGIKKAVTKENIVGSAKEIKSNLFNN